MRPKKHKTVGSNDLFRARLDQIINLKHELVLLAGKVDWDWIDGEIAPLYSENGRPALPFRLLYFGSSGRSSRFNIRKARSYPLILCSFLLAALRRIDSPRIITIKASAPDRRLGGVPCSTTLRRMIS